MLAFKQAIAEWETPLNEQMIGYSALTRKACADPSTIFVMVYWNDKKRSVSTKAFDVHLKKNAGRWTLDKRLFRAAITEKIIAAERINDLGRKQIQIKYPAWYEKVIKLQTCSGAKC